MKKPKVSVCIPVLNGGIFLKEALNSIINQTFKDFEIVVSDDGSIDQSLEIIQEILNGYSDISYKVVYNTKKGIGANWNNCLVHCSGEYVKFVLQDDLISESCLEEMVEVLERMPNIGLVGSKRSLILEDSAWVDSNWLKVYSDLQLDFKSDSKGIVLSKYLFRQSFFLKDPLNKIGEPSGVMFRRSLTSKVGLFRLDLVQVLDFEYWYRFLLYSDIFILNKELFKFRIHFNQQSNTSKNENFKDFKIYFSIVFFKYFFYLNYVDRKRLFFRYTILGRLISAFLSRLAFN